MCVCLHEIIGLQDGFIVFFDVLYRLQRVSYRYIFIIPCDIIVGRVGLVERIPECTIDFAESM